MTMPHATNTLDKLLHNLIRELYQTEISAVKHCQREAIRLGQSAPAEALIAVSQHARAATPALIDLCRREQLPMSAAGGMVGALFSQLRDQVADRLVQSERSYRLTLLGIRHGIDLMRVVAATADAANRLELEQFCQGWLNTRIVLTERVEEELSWFVRHPEHATRLARPLVLAGRAQRIQHS
jgi:hypothetical protein